jgi:hypothetical protein
MANDEQSRKTKTVMAATETTSMKGTTTRAPAKLQHMNLSELTVGELLALSRRILAELRERGVIRTGNAPAGDYAELLVQRATDGELAPNSQKSWDVVTPEGERLQVKARLVTDPRNTGERQLSPFRSWEFGAAVIVLFADDFEVWRAVRIPVDLLRRTSRFSEHVRGDLVLARNELLDQGEDWTDRLRAVTV